MNWLKLLTNKKVEGFLFPIIEGKILDKMLEFENTFSKKLSDYVGSISRLTDVTLTARLTAAKTIIENRIASTVNTILDQTLSEKLLGTDQKVKDYIDSSVTDVGQKVSEAIAAQIALAEAPVAEKLRKTREQLLGLAAEELPEMSKKIKEFCLEQELAHPYPKTGVLKKYGVQLAIDALQVLPDASLQWLRSSSQATDALQYQRTINTLIDDIGRGL